MGLKAAVIGCGRIAWMLEDDPLDVKPCTHMGAYEAAGKGLGIEVVAAADNDPERLRAFGRRHGVKGLYGDYREMLREARPDLVSVCAWATERYPMVMDSIEAGARGIWCEKAFAASIEQGRRMVDACGAGGAALIVSHMRRWSGRYRKARELVRSGGIGRAQSAVCHFSGSFIHTGTHAFDVLRWFLGDPLWVEGEVEANTGAFQWEGAEDRGGRATVMFDGGVHASVHAETRPYFHFEFDFLGDSGRVRIGNNGLIEYYRPAPSRNFTGFRELASEPFPEVEEENWWNAALKNLVGAAEGREENASRPEDGLAALEMALAVYVSSREGGRRVAMPLDDPGISVRSR